MTVEEIKAIILEISKIIREKTGYESKKLKRQIKRSNKYGDSS